VLRRVHEIPTKLGDVADIYQGIVTSADRIYIVPPETDIEEGLAKPYLSTGELFPYSPPTPSARIIVPYEINRGKAVLISSDTLKERYPKGWAYLCAHREALAGREKGKMRHEHWYGYVYPKNLNKFDGEKLIIQVTAKRPTVLYDDCGLHMTGGGSGPFYGIRPREAALPIKYLLAILNSALYGWIIKAQSTNLRGGYIKFSKQYIETSPIVTPDEAGPEKVKALVGQVDEIIRLRQQFAASKSPQDKGAFERQIHAATQQIDETVCELYGVKSSDISGVAEAAT